MTARLTLGTYRLGGHPPNMQRSEPFFASAAQALSRAGYQTVDWCRSLRSARCSRAGSTQSSGSSEINPMASV
jgi:hypothetical protein